MNTFELEPTPPEVSRRIYVTDESIRNLRKIINIDSLDAGIYENAQVVVDEHEAENIAPVHFMADYQPVPSKPAASPELAAHENQAEIDEKTAAVAQLFDNEEIVVAVEPAKDDNELKVA